MFVTLLSALLSLSTISGMFTRGFRACVCVAHAMYLRDARVLFIYHIWRAHEMRRPPNIGLLTRGLHGYSCSLSWAVLRVSLTIFRYTRYR